MQPPTHATFSLVFVILTGTALGLVLTPVTAAFAILGALLPDIDTPMSWIGRFAQPLAARLERRFGHRAVTHSLLGLVGVTPPLAVITPLAPRLRARLPEPSPDRRRQQVGDPALLPEHGLPHATRLEGFPHDTSHDILRVR